MSPEGMTVTAHRALKAAPSNGAPAGGPGPWALNPENIGFSNFLKGFWGPGGIPEASHTQWDGVCASIGPNRSI